MKNKDGSYTLIEIKLTSKTRYSKGQKEAIDQITGPIKKFEVRRDIPEFGITKGETITIENFILNNKYEL